MSQRAALSWGEIYRMSCTQFADLYGFAFRELVRAMGSEEAATAIAGDAVMDIVRQACERAMEESSGASGSASMVLQFEMGLSDEDDDELDDPTPEEENA